MLPSPPLPPQLGIWPSSPPYPSYATACRALALHLSSLLHLTPTSSLVDVGCGYGDSLLLWREVHGVEARGVNWEEREAEVCRRRGLRCVAGSATEGEHYERGCVVVAVDCCYHWGKREWYSVMRRRGVKRVAASDFIVKEGMGWAARAGMECAGIGAGIQKGNFMTKREYLRMLEEMGYRNVEITEVPST
ncbi:hypothetical protein TrRE_jg914, partial [Triparma retinervis]